jgi:hypothetical protein
VAQRLDAELDAYSCSASDGGAYALQRGEAAGADVAGADVDGGVLLAPVPAPTTQLPEQCADCGDCSARGAPPDEDVDGTSELDLGGPFGLALAPQGLGGGGVATLTAGGATCT